MTSPKTRLPLRLAVIWTEVPGYISASLKSLSEKYTVETLVVSNLGNRPEATRRPFDNNVLNWMPRLHYVKHRRFHERLAEIRKHLWSFAPDVIIFCFQWRAPEYYFLVREAQKRNILTIGTMDNTWSGGPKQRFAIFANRVFGLLPFDTVWVPGERAAQYAQRLFDSRTPIWRGLYCADSSLFGQAYSESPPVRTKTFLFVGRFAEEKGISDLIRAYRQYRRAVEDPWELMCVGNGPLQSELDTESNIQVLSFLQPLDVAQQMNNCGAFVLPSQFEPWGVVIHEAALAGMPIICSDACGASVELVQPGFNGLVFRAGDVEELTWSLHKISHGDMDLAKLGSNSAAIAKRYTSELWADQFMRGVDHLLEQKRTKNL